jgi:hypothetical protein
MAKRARKTSSLSPKKKQERKEAKAATEAQTAIVEAVVPFPSDEVKLKEEFLDIPLAIEADIDEAKSDLKEGPGSRKAEHNKRLRQLYKAMPVVTSFIVKIARLPADDRSRAVRQIKHLIARLPIDDQPELPLYEPGSVAADEGCRRGAGCGARRRSRQGWQAQVCGAAGRPEGHRRALPRGSQGRLRENEGQGRAAARDCDGAAR